MTLNETEKIADFYFQDLIDILDENGEILIPEKSITGLKHDEVSDEDFEAISSFGKIVKNYKRMQRLIEKEDANN